jgi:hypothetical protein
MAKYWRLGIGWNGRLLTYYAYIIEAMPNMLACIRSVGPNFGHPTEQPKSRKEIMPFSFQFLAWAVRVVRMSNRRFPLSLPESESRHLACTGRSRIQKGDSESESERVLALWTLNTAAVTAALGVCYRQVLPNRLHPSPVQPTSRSQA